MTFVALESERQGSTNNMDTTHLFSSILFFTTGNVSKKTKLCLLYWHQTNSKSTTLQ